MKLTLQRDAVVIISVLCTAKQFTVPWHLLSLWRRALTVARGLLFIFFSNYHTETHNSNGIKYMVSHKIITSAVMVPTYNLSPTLHHGREKQKNDFEI